MKKSAATNQNRSTSRSRKPKSRMTVDSRADDFEDIEEELYENIDVN